MAADMYGEAARQGNRLSRRLRRNILPGIEGPPEDLINLRAQEVGSDPFKNLQKKVKIKFSENPYQAEMRPRGAQTGPEVDYQENWDRANLYRSAREKQFSGEDLTDKEMGTLRDPKQQVMGADIRIGPQGQRPVDFVTGAQAQESGLSIGDRLRGNFVGQTQGMELSTGTVESLADEIYGDMMAPGYKAIRDFPVTRNAYIAPTSPEGRQQLGMAITSRGGDTPSVDTRSPDFRRSYGSDQYPYVGLDAIPKEDMSNASGNMMDFLLTEIDHSPPRSERLSKALDLVTGTTIRGVDADGNPIYNFGQSSGKKVNLPEGYIMDRVRDPSKPYVIDYRPFSDDDDPFYMGVLKSSPEVVGNLSSSDLGRRLRQSPQIQALAMSPESAIRAFNVDSPSGALAMMGDQIQVVDQGPSMVIGQQALRYPRRVEQLLDMPVENPVQIQRMDPGLAQGQAFFNNAIARQRVANLDAEMIGDKLPMNFVVEDPPGGGREFYLYGAQKPDASVPDAVAQLVDPGDTMLDERLVTGNPYSSGKFTPAQLKGGQVGLGAPIERTSPYNRAFIDVPGGGKVPLDPIVPIDELDSRFAKYGQGKGIVTDALAPEEYQAQAERAAYRFDALAQREAALGNVDRAEEYGRLSIDNAQRAAAIDQAKGVADSMTAPQPNVAVTTISDLGTPDQRTLFDSQVMPFGDAAKRVQAFRSQPQRVLNIPVTPRQGPDEMVRKFPDIGDVAYGDPQSVSILSEPSDTIYKQVRELDPQAAENELRRGLQWETRPYVDIPHNRSLNTTNRMNEADWRSKLPVKYNTVVTNPGVPVLSPEGTRMTWQGEPLKTYDPRLEKTTEVSYGTRVIPTRRQVRAEEAEQYVQALNEGYTPRTARDPYNQIVLTGEEMAAMRGGLSGAEAQDAYRHNRVRSFMGMPPASPQGLANMSTMTSVPTSQRSVDLIQNPPVQGGVFEWGTPTPMSMVDEAQIPTSGAAMELSPGGMIPAADYEVYPTRMVRPSVRTVSNRLRGAGDWLVR
jgi:hypothetical protein